MVRALSFAIVAFLLLAPAGLALEDFTVEVRDIKTSIFPDEQVEIELIISNTQNKDDTFRISAPDVLWSVQSAPLYHYLGGVDIGAREVQKVKLLANPTILLPPGPYKIDLFVTSKNSGERRPAGAFVRVKSTTPQIRDYLAAVARIVDIPENIDPRNQFTISVNLENRNPKNISELKIILTSNLVREEVTTDLKPLAKKTVNVDVQLNPLTTPQVDTLTTTIIADGDSLTPVLKEDFRIISYADIVKKELPAERGFLQLTKSTQYTNMGNVKAAEVIERPVSPLTNMFTSTDPDAFSVRRDGQTYLAWEVELEPQVSTSISVSTDYRPIFFILVIIVIMIVAYIFFRSSVNIAKEGTVLRFDEGGISEVKVVLHIKNRSAKEFERISVLDKLPYITDVEKDIDVGTLKPSKISHNQNITSIRWDIENLDSREERILSYRMRSKLSILGGFILPPAVITFHGKGGHKFVTKSKRVEVKA